VSTATILPGCDVLPPMESTMPRPAKPSQARSKTAGRFKMLNSFLDFSYRRLNRAESGLWLALFRDTRDGVARSGQADLARRVGTNPRHLRRALVRLESLGLLTVVRRGRLGQGPSAYRVHPLIRDPP
jgi:predicted transcriptional regulator